MAGSEYGVGGVMKEVKETGDLSGDNGSPMCFLQVEALSIFYLRLSFQGCVCIAVVLGRQTYLPPEQRAGTLTAQNNKDKVSLGRFSITKKLGFLKLRVLVL